MFKQINKPCFMDQINASCDICILCDQPADNCQYCDALVDTCNYHVDL